MKDIVEDMAGAIFDEYSLKDTIKMLIREHSMSPEAAKYFLRICPENGKFKLYQDIFVDGIHEFENVEIGGLDDSGIASGFVFLCRT